MMCARQWLLVFGAFVGLAALWGALFLLDRLGYVPLGAPLGILMVAVWCPRFWWKYWRAKAAQEHGATEIFIAGGVSANAALRATMIERADLPVRVPPLFLCTDNAAMIAAAGHFRYLEGQRARLDFDVRPTWPLV